MDQAEGLRVLMNESAKKRRPPSARDLDRPEPARPQGPRVISVSSGKGGVGKSNVVANVAFALTQMDRKVLVWDADLGLANMDVLLGLTPRYTIEHLLTRQKKVTEILLQGPGGMTILPASSGVLELVALDESQKIFLLGELDGIAESVDVLLIDTGAGISSNVLYFNMAAEESIIVATPEPTSITDAYALMKVLSTRHHKKRFTILVNAARDGQEAKEVFRKISRVVDRFLGEVSLDYLGFIPFDEMLPTAVRQQRPVVEMFPHAQCSRSFINVAQILAERPIRDDSQGSLQFFGRYLFQCHQSIMQQREVE